MLYATSIAKLMNVRLAARLADIARLISRRHDRISGAIRLGHNTETPLGARIGKDQ